MKATVWLAAVLTAVLGACGGGGGGGSVPPPETVSVTITTPAIARTLAAGDELDFAVEGTWTGNPGSEPFLQLEDGDGRFSSPATLTRLASNGFRLAFKSLAAVPVGTHAGQLTVRACKDAACTATYAGTSASIAYELKVEAVAEWRMFQRNAAHDGYVPITLNPAKFRQIWTWSREIDDPIGGINPVVTSGGKVFVSKDVYFGPAALYALDEATGAEAWKVSLGVRPALNPPAVAGGKVFVATTGHEDTIMWTFDAATGALVGKGTFEGQWPHVLAPTFYGGEVFTNGGYYGGQLYAFASSDGRRLWNSVATSAVDMATPAVDRRHVYFHSGQRLWIWDRITRAEVASIEDPFGDASGYSYHGAPVIGSRNNVVAFAGTAFSGRASSNVEQFALRPLSSFNIATKSFEWATANAYMTAPAIANGVIYAAGSSPLALDAIDEATGQVLWSWTGTAGDSSFHRNIVVTRNLLFVSTDRAVHAIDLATRQSVWSHPEPGMLAISASRVLYIATGARESNGKLVAIKLN